MGCGQDEVDEALALLREEQRVQAIVRCGRRFWGPAGQRYAREDTSTSMSGMEGE